MAAGQKLELTWIGKDKEERVEPRILIYDKEKSYGDQNTGNMLIHGDNLLALKSLEQEYAGKVKCIYIDPPYNTGSAFEQYDDNVEHSLWLSMMRERIKVLYTLLADNGSIWISIDDEECHYLKVMVDEIFGRRNFINSIIWEKKFSRSNDAQFFSEQHDYILVYAKNRNLWRRNYLSRNEEQDSRFKNPDNDSRGPWQSIAYNCNKTAKERPNLYYPIINPNTNKEIWPSVNCVWRYTKERHEENIKKGVVYWGRDGKGRPRFKKFLSDMDRGLVPLTLWQHDFAGDNQDSRKEVRKIFIDQSMDFSTPKPEKLIEKVIEVSTQENDIILDAFLGSGTTAAAAHKMNRRYIGIELGEHCYTHCKVRLDKVIDGEQGGISKAVNWQGGGGYRFYELAPSLLKKDEHNMWVFDYDAYAPEQREVMIAEAIAKLNGYHYTPDAEVFWKQGISQTGSFIFTTTQYVSSTYLDTISKSMNGDERLLVCCPAFDNGLGDRYDNIVVKKIPQTILDKCEFGREGYKINIIETTDEEDDEAEDDDDE